MYRSSSVRLFAIAGACLIAGPADGDELQLLSGESHPARLRQITTEAIIVAPRDAAAGPETTTPLVELYRWGAPAAPARRPTLLLAGGSRLVAAPTWTLDGSVQLDGGRFTLRQMLLEDTVLPRESVRAILFEAARDRSLFASAIREAQQPAGDDDRVWLTSGDAFSGRVSTIKGGRLSISVGGEPLEFGLADVVAVRLAGASRPGSQPRVAVGLLDGGLLLAMSAELNEAGEFEARLVSGPTLSGRRGESVTLVQPLAGRVTYLSDLEPIDYRHTPYFDLAWTWASDENLLGGPLSVGGATWLKGLAMHSAARLVYRVPPSAQTFSCEVALDDSAASGGGVAFRVLVARDGKFEPLYESPPVRPGEAPLPVSIDVAGAQAVALLVDYGEQGDTGDHADWLGARFIRSP